MASPKQPRGHDDAKAKPAGPWREEEKRRGVATPRDDAGAAGHATTKGRPHDDRARTEGVVADIERDSASKGPRSRP